MKKIFASAVCLFLFDTCFTQIIPTDSLYMGQKPPESSPKVFTLSVSQKFFAAERIAISNTGGDIYYSEIKSYYPNTGESVKRYCYSGDKWTGPFNLFEGYAAPALSVTGDTMYAEKNFETFISVKEGLKWSNPRKILSKLDSVHYLQVTNKGNYYISSRPKTGIGAGDWCKLLINAADSTAFSLGRPLNTSGDNLDFFVSKDETYMIVCTYSGLGISYHKKDGSWTNPRNLGAKINFGLGMWGPYVSSDNKYLFYTTGTKEDYSDVHEYWVRIDGLIDSLKYTNLSPYVKTLIKNQAVSVGQTFNFTIPGITFFDEDSNIPLTYSAALINGNPLPSWLSFNPDTRTFSGKPVETGELKIKVIATDKEKASALCPLTIMITANP